MYRLDWLSKRGVTIICRDYRGLGTSQGSVTIPNLQQDAIDFVDEYKNTIRTNNAKPLVIGISLGGIIAANLEYDSLNPKIILDSVPATVERYKCNPSYSPIQNLNKNPDLDFKLYLGKKDNKVKKSGDRIRGLNGFDTWSSSYANQVVIHDNSRHLVLFSNTKSGEIDSEIKNSVLKYLED